MSQYGPRNFRLVQNCELHLLLRMVRFEFVQELGEEINMENAFNPIGQQRDMDNPVFEFHVTWNQI